MRQRGVALDEIEEAMNAGWTAADAKPGMCGKTMVFAYAAEWEGKSYPEKEVTVYYRVIEGKIVVLTVKARYGSSFPRE